MKNFYMSLFILCLWSCEKTSEQSKETVVSLVNVTTDQFSDYWYAGKAEVSSYILEQARYGEMREGTAVLIFVTEPFSTTKQVKLDNPNEAGDDKLTVMKLNFTKKFTTGIYPYSMMLSSFTPVDRYHHPNTVKVTMSSQEWCGHVFTQLNLSDKDKYIVKAYSYFESEGDESFELKKTLLEDEVWNIIRIDYQALPTGDITVIPGTFAVRLRHKDIKPMKAIASLTLIDSIATYKIDYADGRYLAINFDTEFPHKILSWEERYKDIGGKELTTSGALKKTLFIDYWDKNNNASDYLRDSLYLN